jgi:hypothetical protein
MQRNRFEQPKTKVLIGSSHGNTSRASSLPFLRRKKRRTGLSIARKIVTNHNGTVVIGFTPEN